MRYQRGRTGRQLTISIAIAVVLVTVLALLTGTLNRSMLIVATAILSVLGLVGIYLFDRRDRWFWLSDATDFMTIIGLIGLWGELVETSWGWLLGLPFYWGLATLVRRLKYE